jgi:hypothetical protein
MRSSVDRSWRHIILDLRFDTGDNYMETTAFTADLHRNLRRDGKLSILIGNDLLRGNRNGSACKILYA